MDNDSGKNFRKASGEQQRFQNAGVQAASKDLDNFAVELAKGIEFPVRVKGANDATARNRRQDFDFGQDA